MRLILSCSHPRGKPGQPCRMCECQGSPLHQGSNSEKGRMSPNCLQPGITYFPALHISWSHTHVSNRASRQPWYCWEPQRHCLPTLQPRNIQSPSLPTHTNYRHLPKEVTHCHIQLLQLVQVQDLGGPQLILIISRCCSFCSGCLRRHN